MSGLNDLTGRRFGRLTVLGLERRAKNRHVLWSCRCDCGDVRNVWATHLKSGMTTSCGCFRREISSSRNATHGHARCGKISRTYRAWQSMLSRCECMQSPSYKNYGGRGITVCERWRLFENFLEDMGEAPASMSLDRIDNDRGYEPGNCRWATCVQQSRNRRKGRRNTSGYIGIGLRKKRWRAIMNMNSKAIYLGSFDTPEEAARAYDSAIDCLRDGEGTRNFPRVGRGVI